MWAKAVLGVVGAPLAVGLGLYARRIFRGGVDLLKEDILALPVVIHHLWFVGTSGPLFARLLHFRRTGKNVEWNVKCGPNPENVLDVFIPDGDGVFPVLMFVYGGGWNSGDKFWYAFMARELRQRGMVVVLPNYGLFPDARCPEMVEDVKLALEWTVKNISKYKGDPKGIAVVAHSAGGHLVSLAVLQHFQDELRLRMSGGDPTTMPWRVEDILSIVTLAAVFDVKKHYAFEKSKHIAHLSEMHGAMEGEDNFRRYSPSRIIHDIFVELHTLPEAEQEAMLARVPEFHIVHPVQDKTVPVETSEEFYHHLEHLRWPSVWHPVEHVGHSEVVLALFEARHRKHAQVMAAIFGLAHHRSPKLAVIDDHLGESESESYSESDPASPTSPTIPQKTADAVRLSPPASPTRTGSPLARSSVGSPRFDSSAELPYEAHSSPIWRRRAARTPGA